MPKSDIEIAREATMQPITEIGAKLDIPADALLQYGPHKAKLSYDYIKKQRRKPDGKLILVTAITPTPAGEGKTTTTVGLGDGLNKIGKKATICIREPSLGPCFGMKGGAAGGGYAQVVPMEQINLHFTGDFHAITSAHNLLSALIDNHIYWGNKLNIDVRRVVWKRVMDMNDRSLRSIVVDLGGVANGYPRQDGFDITVASEIMAIFCLATDLKDLEKICNDLNTNFPNINRIEFSGGELLIQQQFYKCLEMLSIHPNRKNITISFYSNFNADFDIEYLTSLLKKFGKSVVTISIDAGKNIYSYFRNGDWNILQSNINKFKKNLSSSKPVRINPLEMKVVTKNNLTKKSIAINEVSILRQSRQAASLLIKSGSQNIIKKF